MLALCALLGLAPGLAAAEPRAGGDAPPLARAEALLARGRLYPAEVAAREAIAQDPDSAAAHQVLGRILLRRRRFPAALEEVERARALDPSRPGLDRDLGDVLYASGQWERAREAYARAVVATPDDAALQLRLGLSARRVGDDRAAVEAFQRAAQDPAYAQLALYQLGLARAALGERDAAGEAFERAVAIDPPSPLAQRAWNELHTLEDHARSWSLGLAAGLVYDDNVTRPELDVSTGRPDGATQYELDATWDVPVPERLPDLRLGYGFFQTLYFQTSELDLQSHTASANLSGTLGPVSPSLSYVYSLSTLDGDRFLDFQDLRPSLGFAPRDWWYVTAGPAFQRKRFDQRDDRDRDAWVASVGALQLFDLAGGSWSRYLLLGVDGEIEDADGPEFDARGLSTQLALHWPWIVGERVVPLDFRYRFRWRDYENQTPSIGERREDRIHAFRARAELELRRWAAPGVGVSLQLQYDFEDSNSNLPSADYTQNVVTLLLRVAL